MNNKRIYTLYDVISLCEFAGCDVYKLTHSENKWVKIPPEESDNLYDYPVESIGLTSDGKRIAIYCSVDFEGSESLKDIIKNETVAVIDFQNNPDKFNDDNFESMWAKNGKIIIRTFTGLDKLNEEIEEFNERVSQYALKHE